MCKCIRVWIYELVSDSVVKHTYTHNYMHYHDISYVYKTYTQYTNSKYMNVYTPMRIPRPSSPHPALDQPP